MKYLYKGWWWFLEVVNYFTEQGLKVSMVDLGWFSVLAIASHEMKWGFLLFAVILISVWGVSSLVSALVDYLLNKAYAKVHDEVNSLQPVDLDR